MKTIWGESCFMIDTLERGGAQKQLLLIANYLQQHGLPPYQLIVFREPLTLLKEFKESGVEAIHIQKHKKIDIVFLCKLFIYLKKIKPRVVVTFLITADLWGRLIALLASVPKVGCSVRSIPQKLGLIKDIFLRLMDKYSNFIVCNCRIAADSTVQRSNLDHKKVLVIYNGIPASNEVATSTDKNMLIIGLVARLVPLKDVSTLLRAFAIIHVKYRAKLVIVGDGPCKNALEGEAVTLGIADKACFMGELLDTKDIIKTFDVGVLTSKYEGFSNAIMEYMQAGKPVVATRVGGNSELVDDGVTGYLFDYGNVEQLTKLLELVLSSPNEASKMGRAGRIRILDCFSVESMVEEWEKVLS
jgi:glycosyltransferase involved in cell wall biosynthesis